MDAALSYTVTSLVYLCVDVLACWGLNLQFGLTGTYNLALVVFQSAGAYAAAVVSLGPETRNAGFQHYFIGTHLPFPVPILVGGLVGGALSFVVGLGILRRVRADYAAMVLLVFAVMANLLVIDFTHFLGGPTGLSLIPSPLRSLLGLSTLGYSYVFLGICVAFCAIAYFFVRRITTSPLGRALRMVREDERAAEALGKNAYTLRLYSFTVGGILAGISGALLVEYITAWSPASWGYAETLVILTAIIVGGFGNDWGVVLGALIVPVVISQGSTFLPPFGPPQLVPALQWILIGVVGLVFLFFWPRGILPERKHRFPEVEGVDAEERAGGEDGLAIGALLLPAENVSSVTRHGPPVSSPRGQGLLQPESDRAPVHGEDEESPLLLNGLVKAFGGVRAVDGVDLSVQTRQIVGLIGPNGAGKSTVIGLIGGAIRADAGTIKFAGRDVTNLRPHNRARLGLVRTFQLSSEFKRLSVIENLVGAGQHQPGERFRSVLLPRRSWAADEREVVKRALTILGSVGLLRKKDEYAGNLSGGEKRLLELGRALMADPKLVLLDEPMAGVNPTFISRIEEYLEALRDNGLTILLVEHELASVERLCDRVVVMSWGKVLAEGSMASVRVMPEVQEAYLVG